MTVSKSTLVHPTWAAVNLVATQNLSNYCGQPIRKRTIVSGYLWSCDNWTALELQGQIREVWGNFSATQ